MSREYKDFFNREASLTFLNLALIPNKMIPELTHEDLIAQPSEKRNQHNSFYMHTHPEIMLPNEIPIHPSLLGQEFIYTKEFAQEVMEQTPEMVTQDLETIESKLGFRPNVVLTPA